ncbi:MAG: HAD family hydrolase [Desulfuromonadales bacterium]|nr:HAD family hydrolase [Desulfuromonadales bacterium]
MQKREDSQPIKAILFDLDGTLLRVQMEHFIPRYVERLAAYCAPQIKPRRFTRAMLDAIRRLITEEGDGHISNEQRLFALLKQQLGIAEALLVESLAHYAEHHLDELHHLVHPIPLAQQIVNDCHRRNIPLVLATNPVFPRFMIEARMAWAELDLGLFRHLTSYENSRYCKPQAGYFAEIATLINVPPERCLMVGNDSSHDLAAAAVGMQTFLVDTWLVERNEQKWPCHYRGDHRALQIFLEQL